VANAAAYTLSYDVLTDFRPVALLPSNPMLVLARKDIPADTLDKLIAWLKANPGNVSIASSGAGSPPHVAVLSRCNSFGVTATGLKRKGKLV
jgi:tripartite-type tricarboxylate transporter receptor subunit TctC